MNHEKNKNRVARLYKVAASVYTDHINGKGSIKTLVFKAKKLHPNIKAINALVGEAVNHREVIDDIVDRVGLWEKEPKFQKDLAIILITELLFGKGVLPGTSLPVTTLKKYQSRMQKELKKITNRPNKIMSGRQKNKTKPKYARVNSLCNSLHRVAKYLREEGWLEVMYNKESVTYSEYLDLVKSLKEKSYLLDYHVESLIVFPPGTQLYDHPLVLDGSLMLQDKASCLPVQALDPPPGSCVLDACAAPGMKTSQVAGAVCGDWVARLASSSASSRPSPPEGARVLAIERSSKRFRTLLAILKKSMADTVTEVYNQDFLEMDPLIEPFKSVTHIVLDPSCSGTGMMRDAVQEEPPTLRRLGALVYVQERLLTHALSFVNVERVVYSTCATSFEENEAVVARVLENFKHKFKLVQDALPTWSRRGEYSQIHNLSAENCNACIRVDPKIDLANGFFVALFQRLSNSDALLQNSETTESKKKKKKHKKSSHDDAKDDAAVVDDDDGGEAFPQAENVDPFAICDKKKKKKRKKESIETCPTNEEDQPEYQPSKKQKKKKKNHD